ncbi:ricin-type beta-trefoil lectin domain protein [Streptomyces sp. NBC_00566]|uniref:ricin-type beta-trefoil lectin domain protein n=1 Tax=Streptomyces sp. NBC_00566 TaxID=2975778 RepID=UPI002E7FBF66|nr:ricin-type beta-trefoil lectin domain protein [Streptomyces sp. NBC_00566]WUB85426.1 ricin-type beta-trefoil lectin domain protein [Streptomyces sp. NBC_00566]
MKGEGPSNSPDSARPFGISDGELSAELMKWTGTAVGPHPVGELLDRHWAAAFAYARLCTDGPRAAGMLTTAAFTRLFGESLRQAGPSAAWRPRLLVTVRRIAAEWDGDGRQELLHPALRPDQAGATRAAERLLPAPGRRLLARAFQRLPQPSRAVLWHTEVEGDPLAVPAALLGLDEESTHAELGRARDRLREECLQSHRELAPDAECGRYLRMLDVTFRRGGGLAMDPDLRGHLDTCGHCARTADQLARFNDGLGLALAEAVLGWGAAAYLDSRASGADDTAPPPVPAPPLPFGGEDFAPPAAPADQSRTPSGRTAHRAARRTRRRNLTLAVTTVSALVALPLVLWSVLGSDGGPANAHGATPSPTRDTASKPAPQPSWAGADGNRPTVRGRLHNVASGRCVGIVGQKAVEGAEAELVTCSSAPGQRWRYEADGRLRSDAEPALCLDSRLGYSVRLAPCSATGGEGRFIRYDFTLQGTLVPRWDQNLALTPAATDGSGALVLKNRAETAVQRWVVDTARNDPQMEIVNWDEGAATKAPARSASARPAPAEPSHSAGPTPTPTATATPTAAATPGGRDDDTCSSYRDRCGRDDGERRYGGGYWGGYGGRHR